MSPTRELTRAAGEASTPRSQRRLALVPTRFGPGVAGGAEAVLGDLGQGLRERGWDIEVLTSAARDLYTWRNELPVGESVEAGITVRRFATVLDRSSQKRRDWIGRKISMGWATSLDEQYLWMNGGPRVPGLYEYLMDSYESYDAIILGPYMFWTTFACSEVAPDRSILMPCLHDEPPAYLDIYKPMFSGARGVFFLSEPERDLAARIFGLPPRHQLVGSGIDVPEAYDPDGFRQRHGLEGDFLFYAGRREWGKGWLELVQMLGFANTQLARPLTLVTCGVGELGAVPSNVKIVDLGFVSEQERSDGMAAATVYVQPSRWESFSRTIMEAWLAGTPVIANAGSDVVAWHCARSGGGITYGDRYEFTEALRALLGDRRLASSLAARGREYVVANYRWDEVLDRTEAALEAWL